MRSRLLLLIAIPTLAALILGGVRIASSVRTALAFQRAEERAVLASAVTQLAQQLETERDQIVYYIALGSNGRAGAQGRAMPAGVNNDLARRYQAIQAFCRQTDQATARFRAELARFRGAYPAGTRPEVMTALTGLNSLRYLRQASIKTLMPGLVVEQKYAALLDDLVQMENLTAQGTGDPVLSQDVEVLGLVSRMKDEASEQRAILSAALLQGTLSQAQASALNSAQANQQESQQAFDLAATTAQRQRWKSAVSGSFIFLAATEEQQAALLQARARSLAGDSTSAEAFYDAMSGGINNQMRSVEQAFAAQVTVRSDALRAAAVTSALIAGAAVLAFLTLALILTTVVGRSIVRPLRRLRRSALNLARVQLPQTVRRISEADAADEPHEIELIDVDSTDDIGEVARAFDQVHREAVRLATNEAALRGNINAMFVNLSRRSQSLVERQIRLIDDLEQGEEDSERLGNLFHLDHFATRLRRASENLLVLAGQEMPRRSNQPVALLDVLRAAVSETEQYQRISLDVQPEIAVRGQAVSDVVHLLAELVENAATFSAAVVNASGRLLSSGGVLVNITDQGVGMSAEEIAQANWRLENPPVMDVAVSRRMGLFVVARLAARHGIRIRLRPAPTGGLTALVWLPDEVLALDTAARPHGRHGLASSAPRPAIDGDVVSPGWLAGSGLPTRDNQRTDKRAETGEADQLPAFDSVGSDWFQPGATATAPGGACPANADWQAAEATAALATGGTTERELPKRVPRANLVPGSVSGQTASPPPQARPTTPLRNRFAGFQRGAWEARAALRDGDTPAIE